MTWSCDLIESDSTFMILFLILSLLILTSAPAGQLSWIKFGEPKPVE